MRKARWRVPIDTVHRPPGAKETEGVKHQMGTFAPSPVGARSGGFAQKRRPALVVAILAVALFTALVIGAGIGPVRIAPSHSLGVLLHRLRFGSPLTFTPVEQQIIERLRLPRLLLAGTVGAGLAVVGGVMQGLFRNPLADAGITGVSSGGAFGAVLAITTGIATAGLWTLPVCAFAVAATTALLVYTLAVGRGRVQLGMLLLAGITVSAFMGACTAGALTFTRDPFLLREVVFWLMGGFVNRGWPHAAIAEIIVLPGIALCWCFSRDLNIMLAGEDEATSLGVDVPRIRFVLLVVVALITAACVAVSGPIGFVGLIVPNIVRVTLGPDHRVLLPVSALGGSLFLIIADTLARTILQPQEIPVGIVTAFVGAPFFLVLLYARRRQAVYV
jgi:iron complex transport system permease protein